MASTNKTTNYELSQYVGTDKPTYLGDYNSDMLKIDNAIHGVSQNVGTESARINIVENDIGTMANLQTTEKSSLVGAINEVNTKSNNNATNIGTLSNLTTTDKTSIVNAINEINEPKRSILWTNSNPNASMPQDTIITLSSDDYDEYEVIYEGMDSSSLQSVQCMSKALKGNGTVLNLNVYASHGRSANARLIGYVDDTHLKADACYGFSRTTDYTDNDLCIPLYVIGYKY